MSKQILLAATAALAMSAVGGSAVAQTASDAKAQASSSAVGKWQPHRPPPPRGPKPGKGGKGHIGVPGPIAGAGLPLLLAAGGAFAYVRRRRSVAA